MEDHMNKIISRVGAVLGILFLVSVLDTVFAGYMEPNELCRIFPGKTEFVSGKISADRIPALKDLTFVADSPLISVDYVEGRGRMWRGKVHVAPSVQAGTYHFKTLLRWQKPSEEESQYTVMVFRDEAAYRDSLHSIFRKYLGFPPWSITAVTFPLLVVCLLLSFKLSSQREARLNQKGLATVFKVTRRKEGCEVNFGFGEKDGIQVGDSLMVVDKSRQPIGRVQVTKVGADYATAEVDLDLKVRPDCLVDKEKL